MGNRSGAAALTRKESLMSIADAICPTRLMSETEVPEGKTRVDGIVRRGHSVRGSCFESQLAAEPMDTG